MLERYESFYLCWISSLKFASNNQPVVNWEHVAGNKIWEPLSPVPVLDWRCRRSCRRSLRRNATARLHDAARSRHAKLSIWWRWLSELNCEGNVISRETRRQEVPAKDRVDRQVQYSWNDDLRKSCFRAYFARILKFISCKNMMTTNWKVRRWLLREKVTPERIVPQISARSNERVGWEKKKWTNARKNGVQTEILVAVRTTRATRESSNTTAKIELRACTILSRGINNRIILTSLAIDLYACARAYFVESFSICALFPRSG